MNRGRIRKKKKQKESLVKVKSLAWHSSNMGRKSELFDNCYYELASWFPLNCLSGNWLHVSICYFCRNCCSLSCSFPVTVRWKCKWTKITHTYLHTHIRILESKCICVSARWEWNETAWALCLPM